MDINKFKKLLESKLGDVKPLLSEQLASLAPNLPNIPKPINTGVSRGSETNLSGLKRPDYDSVKVHRTPSGNFQYYTDKNGTVYNYEDNAKVGNLEGLVDYNIKTKSFGKKTGDFYKQTTKEKFHPSRFKALLDAYPRKYPDEIFSNIIPKIYEEYPNNFQNACATKMSLALNSIGITPPQRDLQVEKDFNWGSGSVKKGQSLTIRAKDYVNFLTNKFGPVKELSNGGSHEEVLSRIKNQSGVFTIVKVPGWQATGHVDVFDSQNNVCGGTGTKNGCHFGEGGIIYFWPASVVDKKL